MQFLALGLTVLAALSPLLTLSWLWQVKEWRWDRMVVHLQEEGWLTQLFGNVRPAIIVVYGIVGWLVGWLAGWLIMTLVLFAGLTAMQIATRRQRFPVWTKKAVLIVGVSVIVDALLAWMLPLAVTPLLVLAQPVALTVSWLIVKPVDFFLKQQIIRRARAVREQFLDLTVIGVTGSVGKTTTKELISCVLKDLNPSVTPAHVNTEIGVAEWLIANCQTSTPRLRSGQAVNSQLLIVELGAYRIGEIALMCTYVQPTMGVVTSVGKQHVALFGSEENIARAKAELVKALPRAGRAFLNGDDERTRAMAAFATCPVTIVGTGGSADLEAFDVEETPHGIRFRALDTIFDVPLHGTHNVSNVLLALAVGRELGVSPSRMRELLKAFQPLSKTFQLREESSVRILDDTHNSSLQSLKAAIAWARMQPEERKTLLCADLIEMGEWRTSAEEEAGGLAAQVFSRVITLSDLTARNFLAGGATSVEVLSPKTTLVSPKSLLVCVGRMSPEIIHRVLPRPERPR